ncbi:MULTISPECIES: SusC/RagA family TonB-linked outer membrane protein [Olivibacter]|uniref:SusC/RagA family TonB-linked outer membrane protein n=1 Tax=Olivibacter oleidegradans TaxID=760123 RepID=A0ABV6HP67_9SPHI|nr:SusC/RagA family TonB-linked outer membrane protein [Olivibacter jilunii]MDX3914537.1 SusC/RagA family TonB-linked outer membrane protein [Pseudosphingobacterium sp.]
MKLFTSYIRELFAQFKLKSNTVVTRKPSLVMNVLMPSAQRFFIPLCNGMMQGVEPLSTTGCIQKINKKTTCNSRVTGKWALRRFKGVFWWFFTTKICIKKWGEFRCRYLFSSQNAAYETIRIGRRLRVLKPYTVYLITLKILFCVCLAHARQSSSPEAAHGVAFQDVLLKGKVLSADGEPLPGATAAIKNTEIRVLTDANGAFTIKGHKREGVLIISYLGYAIKEISFDGKSSEVLTVRLIPNENVLDEAVVIGYGQTTRRLNTGSVSKVTAEDIAKQPVGNPLAALQGRVPGMVVTQTSGVPGAAINVQIRGRSSLDLARSRNDPLFIVDGVPFLMGNEIANQLITAANNPTQTSQGGLSPLNLINPADIKSIEVLKDADATAIYGSRGANGVILITTKKGQAGEFRLNFQSYAGWGAVTRTMDFMDTEQYLAMRREAFRNDGIEPISATAPDLLLWDTTRYTDWKKELIGGIASTTDMQLRASGGNQYTRFNLGVGYRREGTVFPGDQAGKRTSVSMGVDHRTPDNKLELNFSGMYSYNISDLTARDLTLYVNLPPNFPAPRDEKNRLKFSEGGVSFAALGLENPYAYLLRKYRGHTANLIGNLQATYYISPGLLFRSNFGYNSIVSEERSTNPSTSIDPQSGAAPSANFANGNGKSWIIEPQLEFTEQWGGGKFNVLLGATWQSLDSRNSTIMATGFANDLLLYSMNAAANLNANNSFSLYRYTALFGRLNYSWKDTYIINLTGRRDGSSRFGPENRFANFGALGAAWLFGNEEWIKNGLPFLSFGKIRASYGVTGNDQIGDYLYLDTWTSTLRPYDGLGGLRPSRLYNPNFKWEINKKFEFGLELGALDDRMLFSAAYYRNRSSNQLVSYALPALTGFNNVVQNLDALVENKGMELSLSTENVKRKDFRWSSAINITFPKTRLLVFPDLEGSSYVNRYEIGQPLNVIKAYRFLGIDHETGVYMYDDMNGDGNLNASDYLTVGHTDPVFFGGLSNTFNLGSFELHCFFEFRKQTGQNYYANMYSYPPGFIFNQPQLVNDRWQRPGDEAVFQRLTSRAGNPLYTANSRLLNSSAAYSDASFIRFKTLSLSYQFKPEWLTQMRLRNLRIYMQGQNLLTWTGYKGADPENQNLLMLPPLRTFTLGLQAIF